MKGRILDFSIQTNSGAISGKDDKRYSFTGPDWMEHDAPIKGMWVDFEVEDNHAKAIYIDLDNDFRMSVKSGTSSQKKDRVIAGLLALFLGIFGIHKFYLGYIGPGVTCFILFLFGIFLFGIPIIITAIIAIGESVIYFTRTDAEFQRIYVAGKRLWF